MHENVILRCDEIQTLNVKDPLNVRNRDMLKIEC